MAIEVYSASHVGLVRSNNEDSFFHAQLPIANHCILAMVSDGVGGKKHGEVASAAARDVFSQIVSEGKLQVAVDPELRATMLDMSARRAHQHIADMSQQNREYTGMACTLVSVLCDDEKVGWVNVGDSRLYYFSKELIQISDDQTIANAMLKDGRIRAEDLATHPDRNTLQYSLGVEAINHPIAPDSGLFDWQLGDKLLLCSDGLTDMVSNSNIADTLQNISGQACVDRLIELALQGGGRDNVTLVLLENVAV